MPKVAYEVYDRETGTLLTEEEVKNCIPLEKWERLSESDKVLILKLVNALTEKNND